MKINWNTVAAAVVATAICSGTALVATSGSKSEKLDQHERRLSDAETRIAAEHDAMADMRVRIERIDANVGFLVGSRASQAAADRSPLPPPLSLRKTANP